MYRCVQHLTERAMSVAHIVISLSLTTRAIVKAGLARGNKRPLTTLCHQPESQLLGKVAQHDTNQMPKHAQACPSMPKHSPNMPTRSQTLHDCNYAGSTSSHSQKPSPWLGMRTTPCRAPAIGPATSGCQPRAAVADRESQNSHGNVFLCLSV